MESSWFYRGEGASLVAPALIDCEVLAFCGSWSCGGNYHTIEQLLRLPIYHGGKSEGCLLREAWPLRQNVSAYDAFYVAAARLYDAQVLTADGPLARAPQVGVVIENVRL